MIVPDSTARSQRLARLFSMAPLAALCLGCSNARSTVPDHAHVAGPPVRGGTLRLLLDSDFDHLSTISAYLETAWYLSRTFARQLVTYPPDADYEVTTRLVPDLAETVPTRENGGLSADGRTYVFHLRRAVLWNTTPPREVTAHDFVRAFKLLCNPVSPVGAPYYYTTTIVGMAAYCAALAEVPPTIPDIRRFVTTREIDGVRALAEMTLEVRLVAPTADFLNIMALPFVSAIPEEYLAYLPDGPEFRQHTLSNGPYAISQYEQHRRYVLERNPVWDPARDPNRPAYVDRIRIDIGSDDALAQLQIEAGIADLGDFMLTSDLAAGLAHRDRRVKLLPEGKHHTWMDFLLINQIGSNNAGSLQRLDVRRAIALAVDKRALVQLAGGPDVARPLYQGVSSAVSGFRAGADQYVTAGDRGDPESARRLLAAAGVPGGVRLRLAFMTYGIYPLEAQAVQASLRRAGIDAQLIPFTMGDFVGRLLPDRQNAVRGEWDVALTGGVPDWFGANGRTIASGFDGRASAQSTSNFGGYNNPVVNAAIDRALVAPSVEVAEADWAEAAARVTADVAIVPLIERKPALMLSSRVRGCVWAVLGVQCSLPAVWLAEAGAQPGQRP